MESNIGDERAKHSDKVGIHKVYPGAKNPHQILGHFSEANEKERKSVCEEIGKDDAPVPFGIDVIVLYTQAIARCLIGLTEALAQLNRIFRARVNALNAHGVAVGRTQNGVDARHAVAVAKDVGAAVGKDGTYSRVIK